MHVQSVANLAFLELNPSAEFYNILAVKNHGLLSVVYDVVQFSTEILSA